VNPLLAVVALAVVAGAVAAVSLRDARGVVLGLAAVAVISPVLADPVPDPVGLAARLVAAILGAYLLWIAARPGGGSALATAPATGGSRIGWPADLLIGAAGAIVGFAAHGLGATAGGPALASAAGFALATLAVTPLLTGRDILRLGVGLVLLLHAGLLVRVALGGTPAVLEQLVTAGLVAALGGALAVLVMAARSDGSGGLELATDQTPPRRREPDAHPLDGTGGDLAVEPR
jgi:hypothetical protein